MENPKEWAGSDDNAKPARIERLLYLFIKTLLVAKYNICGITIAVLLSSVFFLGRSYGRASEKNAVSRTLTPTPVQTPTIAKITRPVGTQHVPREFRLRGEVNNLMAD